MQTKVRRPARGQHNVKGWGPLKNSLQKVDNVFEDPSKMWLFFFNLGMALLKIVYPEVLMGTRGLKVPKQKHLTLVHLNLCRGFGSGTCSRNSK